MAEFIYKLGDEGWELVAVAAPEKNATNQVASYQTLYFKRPKE